MPFKDLIFEQGEEAHETLDILDRDGPQAALEHLAYVASEGDTRDRQHTSGGFVLTWDLKGGYARWEWLPLGLAPETGPVPGAHVILTAAIWPDDEG
jgi:hypothetical protein